jgi:hypothetical protein
MTPLSEEEQETFLDAQSAIYPKIGSELIALTPESWKSAVLKLAEDPGGVKHSIYSEDGRREVVAPSMELFEHTGELERLFRKYGRMWTVAYFRIKQSEGGQWRFNVNYEYPA